MVVRLLFYLNSALSRAIGGNRLHSPRGSSKRIMEHEMACCCRYVARRFVYFSGEKSLGAPLHLLHHWWPIDICCVVSHWTANAVAILGQNAATRKCSKVCQLSCWLSIGSRPVLSGGPVTKYADSHQWQVDESVVQTQGLWDD
jgi:hypothetical protein